MSLSVVTQYQNNHQENEIWSSPLLYLFLPTGEKKCFQNPEIVNPTYQQNLFADCTNTSLSYTHSSRTSFIHCLYLLIQQWLIHIHHHYLRFTNPVLNFWLKNTLFVLKLITYSAVIVIRLFDWIHIIYIFSHHDHTYLCTTTNHHHNNTTHTLLFTYFFVWLWALYYQRMYRSGVTKMLTRNCFTSFKL